MSGQQSRWEMRQGSSKYPSQLSDLEGEAPPVIYGIGDPDVLSRPMMSIVGARRATPYGLAVAEMAGRVAAECGIVVVSGGALGCDHAASAAALDYGGKTVVIPGCGADVVYPRSSKDVFDRAESGGGAVISIEPWGTTPRRFAFPRRNAIIAALSKCLFVTEAGNRSGTMSTADVAVRLGRTVFAIPGSIFSPLSAGTNKLISEGAQMICDEQALETAISLEYDRLRLVPDGAPGRPQGRLLSALVASPSRPQELAERLNEDVLDILRSLSDYEAGGLVTKLPDGRYAPSKSYYLGNKG
ncbi:MAG: DNA-processing protein DprA [Tractidigestivibacter sp.]|jgi:DNA processing protein|uniref:DNA-processing protein DprA n=1 Tax=Tractidigestivibacter sp. TaxID=2847320 RepID=UPI003D8BC50F